MKSINQKEGRGTKSEELFQSEILLTYKIHNNVWCAEVCSGSVVVTAYEFESGRPGSNPEWG